MVVLDPNAEALQQPVAVDGEELEQHGDVYAPRTGPVVVTHDKLVYLFGGSTRTRRVDDLHVLDMATTTWTCVEPEGDLRPGPRSLAGGVLHGDRLYVFGGQYAHHTPCAASLFAFDFGTRQWEELPGADSAPTGRIDFTMSATGQELVVLGGHNGEIRYNELFTYSLADSTWRHVTRHGKGPSSRIGHSAVVHAGSNRLIVFGGFDGVFGGIDQQLKRFNDLFRLDLLTNAWTKVQINMPDDQVPPTRIFHRMVVVDQKLLVLGGYDGDKRYNSLHAFDLEPKKKENEDEMLAMRMRIVMRL